MIIAYSVLFVNLFFCIGARKRQSAGGRHAVSIPEQVPFLNVYLLTENMDTGYPVLHECGIGCGTVHREAKR